MPVAHDRHRRWMGDDYFDLIIWYEHDGSVHGFQLCYDKFGRERSLTWTPTQGVRHDRIDTGEQWPTVNCSPVLVPDNDFPAEAIRRQFLSRSTQVAEPIRNLVLTKIGEFVSLYLAGPSRAEDRSPGP